MRSTSAIDVSPSRDLIPCRRRAGGSMPSAHCDCDHHVNRSALEDQSADLALRRTSPRRRRRDLGSPSRRSASIRLLHTVPRPGETMARRAPSRPLQQLLAMRADLPTSRWATTPTRAEEPGTARCPCRSGGKRARRSLACSVVSTRWPVSAAWMAMHAVSPSRISPTMITSGSARSIDAGRRRT